MGKFTKTFESGEVLNAEDLNSLADSLNDLVDDVNELNGVLSTEVDGEATNTKNGCTISGIGNWTINSSTCYTGDDGIIDNVLLERTWDYASTTYVYVVKLVEGDSDCKWEGELTTLKELSKDPLLDVSDTYISGGSVYIEPGDTNGTYILESLDITDAVKACIKMLKDLGEYTSYYEEKFTADYIACEGRITHYTDEDHNDVDSSYYILYEKYYEDGYIEGVTEIDTIYLPIFIPKPCKKYLNKTITIDNGYIPKVSSINSGYTYGGELYICSPVDTGSYDFGVKTDTEGDIYPACAVGDCSQFTCMNDLGFYYWKPNKSYNLKSYRPLEDARLNIRVDLRLTLVKNTFGLSIELDESVALEQNALETYKEANNLDENGLRHDIYVTLRPLYGMSTVACASRSLDLVEDKGSWYRYPGYLYNNASTLSSASSELVPIQGRSCYVLWHTAGPWAYNNQLRLIEHPDTWFTCANVTAKVDESYSGQKIFYDNSNPTTKTALTNPAKKINITVLEYNESKCREVWYHSPMIITNDTVCPDNYQYGLFMYKSTPYFDNLWGVAFPTVKDLYDGSKELDLIDGQTSSIVDYDGYSCNFKRRIDETTSYNYWVKIYRLKAEYRKQNIGSSTADNGKFSEYDGSSSYTETESSDRTMYLHIIAGKYYNEYELEFFWHHTAGSPNITYDKDKAFDVYSYKWCRLDSTDDSKEKAETKKDDYKTNVLDKYYDFVTIKFPGLPLGLYITYVSLDTCYNPGEPEYMIGNTGSYDQFVKIISDSEFNDILIPEEYWSTYADINRTETELDELLSNNESFLEAIKQQKATIKSNILKLISTIPKGNYLDDTAIISNLPTSEPIVGKKTYLGSSKYDVNQDFAIGSSLFILEGHAHHLTVLTQNLESDDSGCVVKIDVTIEYNDSSNLCKPLTYSIYQIV